VELQPGDLLVLDPQTPHHYRPAPGPRWDQFWVMFEGPVFDLWQVRGRLGLAAPLVRLRPVAYWLERFQAAACLPVPPTPHDVLRQVCRWLDLLAEVAGQAEARGGGRSRAWVRRAVAAVERDLADPAPLPAVARELGLSYEAFRKRFREWVGVSPGQHRMERRIEWASRLLLEGEAPLKDIARRVGFCDEFDFSRRFKRVTGVAPSRYRRRALRA
jgi:AraC-like DNA-binding protein